MMRRALFVSALWLALGCQGQEDACKNFTGTCVSFTVTCDTPSIQVDEWELFLDNVRKWASPGMVQSLPMVVGVDWPDGRHSVRLESYLSGMRNGVTNEITLDASDKLHLMQDLKLTPSR